VFAATSPQWSRKGSTTIEACKRSMCVPRLVVMKPSASKHGFDVYNRYLRKLPCHVLSKKIKQQCQLIIMQGKFLVAKPMTNTAYIIAIIDASLRRSDELLAIGEPTEFVLEAIARIETDMITHYPEYKWLIHYMISGWVKEHKC
jgi:hypothetical protein